MFKRKFDTISPLVFAAACVLLTLIISIFAFNNYRREKILMTEMLVKQGETISRFVIGSTRATVMRAFRNNQFQEGLVLDSFQNSLEEAMEHPGLIAVYVIGDKGRILASSQADKIGYTVQKRVLEFVSNGSQGKHYEPTYRVVEKGKQRGKVFQFIDVKPFNEELFRNDKRRSNGRFMFKKKDFDYDKFKKKFTNDISEDLTILVELDMTPMDRAVKRQLIQIVALSITLLLVGIGGWLSINTLHRLRGSQSRLRSIEAFRNQLVSSLPVGLIATDDHMQVQVVNQVAGQLLEISEQDVLGYPVASVLPEGLYQKAIEDESGERLLTQFEYTELGREGQKRVFDVYCQKIVGDDNEKYGRIFMLQDLTDRKNLEADLHRNERFAALGKVAAGVAHELRNPLSSIKGLALLTRKKLNGDQQGHINVDMMVKEIERLDRSIRELLDFARPENLQLEEVPLESLANDAVEIFSTDFASGDIKVSFKGNCENLVRIDTDKIKQVFLNIFLNAIQAMKGGGYLNIDIKREEQKVVCTIEDSGGGIPEDVLKKVFDPYFTTKNEGTGLGLAISAKIIEEHEGSLAIESKEGKGTRVTIKLPAI